MRRFFLNSANLLRGVETESASSRRYLFRLLITLVLFGGFYGLVMGTYGGMEAGRWRQPIFSGLKVPLLLLVTFFLSLPSFFVLNTLMGLRDDFTQVLRALIATQAGLTVVLASLAPLTAFWYVSVAGYDAALAFNAGMFAAASFAGQFMLRRAYRSLIARDPRHRLLMRSWLVIFAFVGIQLGWVLRPFVGTPSSRTTFFRQGAWGNAYVEVGRTILRAAGV